MSDLLKAIQQEAKKGQIVYRSIDGLHLVDEKEFIKQSANGILYDLNRGEETTAAGFDEYRGVNDYAVARTIRALKERIRELEACPPLKWNHVHENQWEAVLPFGQGKYTIVGQPGGYFSALWGHNALPGRFDTLEAAQSACQDHWLDKWKDEMGRMA